MQTPGAIACCLCGKEVSADRAVEGRCLACLALTIDITEGISRELEVEMCRTCEQTGTLRWYRNPQWVAMEAESAELLALCVKRVRGLKAVRLVDAAFIWTEPHSRRLKVKLTVARDVLSGQQLQQSFVVEFVVKTRNCDRCNKLAAKDTWQWISAVGGVLSTGAKQPRSSDAGLLANSYGRSTSSRADDTRAYVRADTDKVSAINGRAELGRDVWAVPGGVDLSSAGAKYGTR